MQQTKVQKGSSYVAILVVALLVLFFVGFPGLIKFWDRLTIFAVSVIVVLLLLAFSRH